MDTPFELRIAAPVDGDHTNQTSIDVIVSIVRPGGGDHPYKYLKLVLDDKVVPQLTLANKVTPATYTFLKVDVSSYANSGLAVKIEARAYEGESAQSRSIVAPSIRVTIDTAPPRITSVFPQGRVEKGRLGEPITVEVIDDGSRIDLAVVSATIAAGGRSIDLTPQEVGVVEAKQSQVLHFGRPGLIASLGLGAHQLNLSLRDAAGNVAGQEITFQVEHAVPFESGSFQICRSFTDLDDRASPEPFVLPPRFSYGEDALLVFPGLATGPGGWAHPADGPAGAIAASTKDGRLEVRILAAAIWSAEPVAREALFADFLSLLAAVDASEPAAFLPGAAAILRARAGRSLPLALSEVLPWSCGLDRVRRAVELLPGFRLRIHPASFQYTGPGRDSLNGMVPAGEIVLPVARFRANGGAFNTGLDPWGGELAPQDYTAGSAKPDGMIGGIADLAAGDLRRRHLAIVLPATIPPSSTASALAAEHVILVAADSRTALAAGIGAAANGTSDHGYTLRALRGHTTVSVEIPVVLDGQAGFVPLGATPRQLADRSLHWFTPAPAFHLAGQLTWRRQWTAEERIVLRSAQWLELGLAPTASPADVADAPLLPGDQIQLRLDP